MIKNHNLRMSDIPQPEVTLTRFTSVAKSQYIAGNSEGKYHIPHIPPMVLLLTFQSIVAIASAVLMKSDEWALLAGLAFGSSLGAIFGMLYSAFSRNETPPWQILAYRGAMHLSGGIGMGVLGVLWETKQGWEIGPLMTIGTGFLTGWLCVAIAMVFEPRLIKLLESRGDIVKPLPRTGSPTVRLVAQPPTAKIDT